MSEDELVAVRKEVKLRLAIAMLSACLLLFFREPIAYRVTSAILAVAVTLLISKLGFGMQLCILLIKILNIRTKGVIIMASKETFTQHLAHEVVQAVVHRERYGLPPDSQCGMFQPTRPEETEKVAVKEDR